ncbi:hypothetical protein LINGRAHAP2_LOCUS4417, partial [Linum grandiflorum]
VQQKKIALICSSEQDSEAGAAKASDSSHLLLDSMFDFAGGGRTNTDFQGMSFAIPFEIFLEISILVIDGIGNLGFFLFRSCIHL